MYGRGKLRLSFRRRFSKTTRLRARLGSMDKTKVVESASKLIAKGQFDKAVKEYQRVLELDPDDVRVLQKLAELYQKMRKQSEAADCFEKVARTYAAQGFYLKAVALYKQVLKVVERVEVNVRLAELYQQLGLVGDATKEWQTVASHYEKTGDHKASLDTLKKLVDLDPDNVASRIRLGEQYARTDNLVEAVAELRRAAQYLQRNGRDDDYLRVAERISHLDQGDVALARELAEHFLSRGDSKRALSKLQICFKANPRDLNTLQMLARAFQDLGQTTKTVSVLKELARVHADAGRTEDARTAYEQAAELAPDDPEVRAGLQSPGPSRRAAARPPTPPTPPARTGPVAPAPARSAQKPQPPAPAAKPAAPPPRPLAVTRSGDIAKLLKETDVYVKYGLHDKALEHLRKIFEADPDNLEAHEKAKAVAVASGRTDDAVQELTTLVRLYTARRDPRAEQARKELRELESASSAEAASPSALPERELELSGDEQEQELELELDTRDRSKSFTPVNEVLQEAELEPEPEPQELMAVEEDEPLVEVEPEPLEVPAPAAAQGDDEFASDLAEADFYIESGLMDEARAILEAIFAAHPRHEGARARWDRLGPATKGAVSARPAAAARDQRDHDDLAAELASELAEEISAANLVEDTPLDGDVLDSFQVPAHEVLGEFRSKVAQTVRREDAQTHYDLGIAYKEMGLLEEAISEFEIVLRHGGGARRADCYTMLGTCETDRGNAEAAVKYLEEGLQLEDLSAEARRALAFELGNVLESLGQNDAALEHYQSVAAEERGFRDVAARIQRLGGGSARPRPAMKAAARPAAHPVAAVAEKKQPEATASRNRKIGFV
jgi:tetratricopeptide (TPR) repeat protein